MKTRAEVLRKGGEPWELTELDLDEPKAGEVLIRMEAAADTIDLTYPRGTRSEAAGYMTGQTLVLDGGGLSPFPLSRPPDTVQPSR